MKDGWVIRPLSDLCSVRPPKSEARVKLKDSDLVSFLPMEDLDIDNKHPMPRATRALMDVEGSYTYFADGDVLLAKITPCFENGKLGIASGLTNGCGFGSSEFFVIRPTASLNAEYLYYFLSRASFRAEGARSMGGAVGHQRVTKEFIESYPVPVPPLPEQQRIVAILDEAFEGLALAAANAEKNLKNARELFDGSLRSAFSENQDGAPLSELACEITDGDHMPPPKASTGIPFITISDIVKETRKISLVNTFKVPESYYHNLKPNRRPRIGDVLYTVTGATLGIPVLVDKEEKFCFQRHIGLIRPKQDTDSRWLSYAMLSPQVFDQATAGSTGAAQKTVSLTVLRNIRLPRIPLSKQRVIASRLKEVEAQTTSLKSVYRRKLARLDELKQSLLTKAFAGDLT